MFVFFVFENLLVNVACVLNRLRFFPGETRCCAFTVTSGCYTCIYFIKMIQMSRPRSTANEFLWSLLLLRNHFISIVGKSLFLCWDTFLSVCFRFHSDISDFYSGSHNIILFKKIYQQYPECFEMWRWRTGKINWSDCWKNEVLYSVKKQRDILHKMKRWKSEWIYHILRRKCLL